MWGAQGVAAMQTSSNESTRSASFRAGVAMAVTAAEVETFERYG